MPLGKRAVSDVLIWNHTANEIVGSDEMVGIMCFLLVASVDWYRGRCATGLLIMWMGCLGIPIRGHNKDKVDASFLPAIKNASLGAVARDHFGLELAIDNGFQLIEMESDCLQAISEIKKQGESFWEGGGIVNDICDNAKTCVDSLFGFVHREANSLAHTIARLQLSVSDVKFWWNSLPESLCTLID
ncbi:hypothetical protein REPUB_Repub10bG0087900 [Reevesia pubescens]